MNIKAKGTVTIPKAPRSLMGLIPWAKSVNSSIQQLRDRTWTVPNAKAASISGRFLVRFSKPSQKLFVSIGTVALVDMDDPGQSEPEVPLINGVPAGSSEAFWDLAETEITTEDEYVVSLVFSDSGAELNFREEQSSGSDDGDGGELILARMAFADREGDEGGYRLSSFEQLWESDVIWPKTSSSSSSESSSESSSSSSESSSSAESSASSGSSAESSGGSSGESSNDSGAESSGSDKSTAIVPVSFHDSGYAALFTMESNQVLFEFVIRDVPIFGRETQIPIDKRFVEVCEPDSLTICGSPCGDLPYTVGAEVKGGKVIVRAQPRKSHRPRKVTMKLTGVRKGFASLDMPSRTREQFIANEKFINSAYPKS